MIPGVVDKEQKEGPDKNTNADLSHDDNFLTRKIELFDRLSQYNLGCAVRIDVRSVKCLDAHIISGQERVKREDDEIESV